MTPRPEGRGGDPPGTGDRRSREDRPLREVRGVVERITYQNPKNGYTVSRLHHAFDAYSRTVDELAEAG